MILLERDGPIGNGGADELFDDWERPGISHFRQPHNFLGLARRVLLDEAPDVLDGVLGLGAVENRQYELLPGDLESQDESFISIFARRPVFESALRRAVDREAEINVETALVLMIPPWERDLRVLRFEKAYMVTALSMPHHSCPGLIPSIDCEHGRSKRSRSLPSSREARNLLDPPDAIERDEVLIQRPKDRLRCNTTPLPIGNGSGRAARDNLRSSVRLSG